MQKSQSHNKGNGTLVSNRHTPWHPSKERDAADPELANILSKVSHCEGSLAEIKCRELDASVGSSFLL